MRKAPFLLLILAVVAAVAGCAHKPDPAPIGPAPWIAWRSNRLVSVAGTNGWITLAGLHWLREGPNTIGTADASPIALPPGSAPPVAGVVTRTGMLARFKAARGVVATIDGAEVSEAALRSDAGNAEPSVLRIDDLSITVIQRGERLGLRVRDPKAPTRMNFRGLDYYDHDPRWRIEGRFEASAPGRTLAIDDVTGAVNQERSPGTIVFTLGGQEHRLEALSDEETHDLFILFRDATAGETTYGAGRFLHVALPGADSRVVIDFNHAYNPPCAFTGFATCPVPPRQNWLPFPVEAGELKYRGDHP